MERFNLIGLRIKNFLLVLLGIIIYTCFLNGWSLQEAAEAAEGRDPFALPAGVQKIGGLPKKAGAEAANAGQESTPEFRVTTILVSGRIKVAGINGVLKKKGDELYGYRITEIEEKRVTLVRGKEKLVLKIDSEAGYSFKKLNSNNSIMGFSK